MSQDILIEIVAGVEKQLWMVRTQLVSGEHDAVRAALGPVGAWTFAFDARSAEQIGIDARALESLGYAAVWVPEGSSSRDIFAHLSLLATRSERITVCSGSRTSPLVRPR